MENIGTFLAGCEAYGLKKTDLFQTVDLYEAQNMPQVIATIHALGRRVSCEANLVLHKGLLLQTSMHATSVSLVSVVSTGPESWIHWPRPRP